MLEKELLEKELLDMIEDNIGVILKISGVYASSCSEREDLTNDIIFSLCKSFPTFKGQSKKSTWLYRVALNTALSHKKRQKSRVNILYQAPFSLQDSCFTEAFSAKEEMYTKLYKSIEMLADFDKAIIVMVLDKLSHADIANITGMSISNVSTRVNRIKNQLRILVHKNV